MPQGVPRGRGWCAVGTSLTSGREQAYALSAINHHRRFVRFVGWACRRGSVIIVIGVVTYTGCPNHQPRRPAQSHVGHRILRDLVGVTISGLTLTALTITVEPITEALMKGIGALSPVISVAPEGVTIPALGGAHGIPDRVSVHCCLLRRCHPASDGSQGGSALQPNPTPPPPQRLYPAQQCLRAPTHILHRAACRARARQECPRAL